MTDMKRCKNKAQFLRVWPGREPDLVCGEHAEDTRKVADALGMPVPIAGIWAGDDPCACYVE